MPTLILIAGPNGAGKTTLANEYLTGERSHVAFVNADEIARELAASERPEHQDIRAARLMLRRLNQAIAAGENIVVETTLATRTYAAKIPQWQERGYFVTIIYLRLPHVQDAIERVRRRVEAGGHSIPTSTIERRFGLSLLYFEMRYKKLVNAWYELDTSEARLVSSEASTGSPLIEIDMLAAARRAATAAVHGTREQRAGRFLRQQPD